MARLRASEEQRTYTLMLPTRPPSNPFSVLTSTPTFLNTQEDGEANSIVHESSSRQVTVVVNILISIICTFFALFFAARSWSPPPRVALAIFGALGVGVAEVGVYWGYLNRLSEARKEEKALAAKEIKEVMEGESWVIKGKTRDEGIRKKKDRRKVD
jgi:TMEM199 family protein